MTEILRFEMNVPAEVALKDGGPGKPIQGRYGNRVMYTLSDNRVMYVAPVVASRISDLGIEAGERFQVRKQLKKQGSRRLIEWEVQRVSSEPETPLEHELRESIAIAQNAKVLHPSEVSEHLNPQPPLQGRAEALDATPASSVSCASTDASDTPPATARNENSQVKTSEDSVNASDQAGSNAGCIRQNAAALKPALTPVLATVSNGSANGSRQPAPRNGNSSPLVATKLEHALKTAISAAYNAEKYGAELGYVVRFDADAIKSMAITVLINMSEGNRR